MLFLAHCTTSSKYDEKIAAGFIAVERSSRDAMVWTIFFAIFLMFWTTCFTTFHMAWTTFRCNFPYGLTTGGDLCFCLIDCFGGIKEAVYRPFLPGKSLGLPTRLLPSFGIPNLDCGQVSMFHVWGTVQSIIWELQTTH